MLLLFHSFGSSSHQRYLMVCRWGLSDSKYPRVSKTLLSILNSGVVWMVSTCPPISKFSSLYTNPLVTVPSTPITSAITVTFVFHDFYSSQARSRYLFLFSLSFSFTLWSAGTAKITSRHVLFFFLFFFFFFTITTSGRLAEIR